MRILLTVGLNCAQLTGHVDWGTYACWTVASWHSRKVLYTHTHNLTGVDGDISDCDVLRRPAWSNPDCSAWQCQQCNTLKCQVCDLHRRLCAVKSESSQLLARYINSHLYQKLIYETLDFNSPCTTKYTHLAVHVQRAQNQQVCLVPSFSQLWPGHAMPSRPCYMPCLGMPWALLIEALVGTGNAYWPT